MNRDALTSLLLPVEHQARLALVPEQREGIAPILQDELEQLREVRSDLAATTSRRDRFFLICEARWIREEADNRIEMLLNDSQQPAWEDIRQIRRAELRDSLQRYADFPHSHPPVEE